MIGYGSPRSYRFLIGFEEIKKTFSVDAVRFYAARLAGTRQENVKVLCYNDSLSEWIDLGTAFPKGYFVNSYGDVCTINRTGDGYDLFGKYGQYYTMAEVKKMGTDSKPHIINAAANKIEFDNGVVFVYDFIKKGYKLIRGSHMSYSSGYDTNYDEEGGDA